MSEPDALLLQEAAPLLADHDNDDGVVVANRRRDLASRSLSSPLTARALSSSSSSSSLFLSSPYAAHVESVQSGKVSIEREGDAASLVHFATGQAIIEQQVNDSGVRQAFFNDRSIALLEQTHEHELLLDADRAIAAALLGRNRVRRGKHRRADDRDELEVIDALSSDSANEAEMVQLESSPRAAPAAAQSLAAPLTKLDAMQLLKTLQACDLITPQCRQFYTRKLVNTTVVGEADGALALMAAFGDNLAELAAELHTYADLPPPPTTVQANDVAVAAELKDDPDVPRRRRSSSQRAAKEKSRPPTGPPTALAPALVKKSSTVGSGRLRVRFAETTDDNNDAAVAPAVVADDDDESGDPLDKAPRVGEDASKKKSRGKKHHRSSSRRNAANFAPVSAAARANAKIFRIDKPQTNAAFDERLTKIMNDM